MREIVDVVLGGNELAARAILDLFATLSAPDQKAETIKEYFEGASCRDKSEGKFNRLSFGYFSDQDLLNLLLRYRNKHSLDFRVSFVIISHVIERLAKYGLVIRNEIPGFNEIKISENTMQFFNKSGLAYNIVFGASYMINRISPSIPAINVRNKLGDVECGSGIVIRNSIDDKSAILITNRHILDDKSIINVISNGSEIEMLSSPVFHSSADLAAIRINPTAQMPLIPIDNDVPVLTPVVSLGYPRIPLATGQFLLAHRGEINGSVTTFSNEQFLVISCHVGPGNSGGPIVTEAGFCAGIVTQSGIGEFGSDSDPTGLHRTTYHMAVPPAVLSGFISTLS